MLGSIWQDIKQEFSYGNTVTRIIIVNVAFFVFIYLLKLMLLILHGWSPESSNSLFDTISRAFMISSDWMYNLRHPWNIFTHMFLHLGVFHILWNMLIFYWFGRIVGDLIGDHRVLPIYLVSGLGGATAYFITANLIGNGGFAYGASAAVMGTAVAAAVLSPDHEMHLFIFGRVKLKFIVGALLLLDLISVANDTNSGGAFGHLGGAVLGWLFVYRLGGGADWSVPINKLLTGIRNFFSALFSRRPNLKAERNPNAKFSNRKATGGRASDPSHQERIDAILDKIKVSGYDSLTKEEKEFLFRASKK